MSKRLRSAKEPKNKRKRDDFMENVREIIARKTDSSLVDRWIAEVVHTTMFSTFYVERSVQFLQHLFRICKRCQVFVLCIRTHMAVVNKRQMLL